MPTIPSLLHSIFSALFPLFDWLYILQIEEYNSKSFLSWILHHFFRRSLQKKKQLIWTKKMLVIAFITSTIFLFDLVLAIRFLQEYKIDSNINVLLVFFFTNQISFLFILAVNFLLEPINDLVKILYTAKASRILRKHPKLIVIGITGSYGKTSTKEILKSLLETKYSVLTTPYSYNTVVGIADIIIKNLTPEHEIFIVEMGAYTKGEIKRICQLVKPQLGIITGLNEQHLDRFKTIENTLKAKTELIDALPSNGLLAINIDSDHLHKFFENKLKNSSSVRVIPYSITTPSPWQPKQLKINPDPINPQTTFTLKDGKKTLTLNTKLLGKHNVLNIMGALVIAKTLGIPKEMYYQAIADLQPVEHRLQIVPTQNGITVIDDAYSGNPDGFKAALEVLVQFPHKRKIIITPGIVELGKKEYEVHKNLGKIIGMTCTMAILIGKPTQRHKNRIDGLIDGIKETAFKPENIFIVKSLDDAQKIIAQKTKPNDLILFENDLPDQY